MSCLMLVRYYPQLEVTKACFMSELVMATPVFLTPKSNPIIILGKGCCCMCSFIA